MSVIRMPYSNEKIAMLKQILVNSAQNGKPKDYEIKVDEMKIVPRTNDLEQFDSHEESIGESTSSVTIILYDGASRNNTKHIFLLKDEQKKQEPKGLSGVEIEKKVSDKVEEVRKQLQYERLGEEKNALANQLKDAEEYIDKLQKEIEFLQSKRGIEDMKWGKLAGVAAETIIRRNVHLIAKLPGAEGLAGILAEDNERSQQLQLEEPQEETRASFKRNNAPEISETDKDSIEILSRLQENFEDEQLNEVMDIIVLLIENPDAIIPAKAFIGKFRKQPTGEKPEQKEVKNETKAEEQLKELSLDEMPQSPIS